MSKTSRERWQGGVSVAVSIEDRRAAFKIQIDAKIADGTRAGVDANVTLLVDVGPVEAEVLLSYSRGNRRERHGGVDAYARDMAAGRWLRENGNPLSFDVNGRLTNGHHRLQAIIRSESTIKLLLSFGNPPSSIDVQDAQIPRSMADRFGLQRGLPNANKRLAALRMCMALVEADGNKIEAKLSVRRTLSEFETGLAEHRAALGALKMSSQFAAAYWGALLFAHPCDPTEIERFANEIDHPEGISGPAFTLREYLLAAKGTSAGSMYQIDVAKRTLYAVRAYLERRPLSKFAPKSNNDGKDTTMIFDWFRARRAKAGARQ